MDLKSLLTGEPSANDIEKAAVIKYAKQNFPHLVYDLVPLEFDDKGNVKNKDTASAIWGWQRDIIYNLKPKETPFVISHLTNGMGKSYVIGLSLTLLLLEDHPALSKGFEGLKGDIWLITNSSLLKSEYIKIFFQSPGFLGEKSHYDKYKTKEVENSRGEKFVIKPTYSAEGALESIQNLTTGKNIKFYSYAINEQKLAGHNPLSIFCDEFGDVTKTGAATGANRLTWGKVAEMLVRCGRNHLVADNWVFCMFFTLTLGETWIENVLEECRNGTACIPELNVARGLPETFQNVMYVKAGDTRSNPFINKSTISAALGFAKLAGQEGSMDRRLIDASGEDPSIVFPRSCRPTKLSIEKVQGLLESSKGEPGWALVESIDPGWRDKCAIIFALCHPVKGIFILNEFYRSGYTVPKVAEVVKQIEYSFFGNRKVDMRLYDPNHIKKTTQESPVANYTLWRNSGLSGIAAKWSKDRAYDRMFELILRELVYYYPLNCEGLDKELKAHRKDQYGVPEAAGYNHSIDAMRHICNWYYELYAKKIHLANPIPTEEMSEGRRHYLAQVEYYNQFIKPELDKKKNNQSIMGVNVRPITLKGIRGFN